MAKNELEIIAEFKSKWLEFEIIERKPKTVVIGVTNDSGETLGEIYWFTKWRCYTFEPDADTVYEKTCLRDVANLLEQLTMNQKQKRSDEQN